ncbi:3'-5' exoribonuclease (CSL4) [Theileria annulata]|uniref:3'-5' exoribonuclease (CSL4 homologue), putative n=1 Tax=Theileria annulata TaxID=5874 RepID=Q4UGP6_THEAN|nr:3'-5' exoribonuclease (CSL4) [Theileria annulata]CAI73743.1 3'-5' exoribonuclease (CSL4 homologue), putative [Theileria annulata]|eukprot:XP_954420.1 3'-5' exoribonuclease (CSL4 homologue), putative [Theileria annulata]
MEKGMVLPGMMIGTTNDYVPLNNVYVRDSVIYSAVLGNLSFSENKGVSVVSNHVKIPYVGATVIAQITRVHINKADCNIISVDGRVLKDFFKGSLTNNNVLESKNIEILMYEWFRPGDFIKCKVIYAGDGKQFTLSTAGLGLGVIKTTSSKGEEMVPISWKYFMSKKSGALEKRKVAKSI